MSQEEGRSEDAWLAEFRARADADQRTGARLPPVDPLVPPRRLVPRPLPRLLWIYWAQGWDQAPEQSRLCLASWERHNPDWRVIRLDDTNAGEHADLGTFLDGKDITVTARSNHLRMRLLARHGGVWVDASTFCSRPLSDWLPGLMQSGFFAFSRPGPDRVLATWFLAAEPDHPLILRWRDLMERYWRNVDRMDFYHWSHYLFAEGCRSDPLMNALWHDTPQVGADGPHQVQFQGERPGADAILGSLAERRVPVHKLETRSPTLPERDAPTPLARLLYGDAAPAPRASVVMCAYGDVRFLDEAVDSVLAQEFRDLELVLVDDGTGATALFAALARRDPRIRLVTNPVNVGTAESANRGIAAARGDIIVRLDADDVAEPARVRRLVEALDAEPDLGLVGSWVRLVEEDGREIRVQPMPESDLAIRWTILFHNPFYHSAVAFRRRCFEAAGGYRVEELVSQDHYLWFDMLPHCRAANLAAPLIRYRHNSQGLTARNAMNRPRARTHAIREASWAALGLTYDPHDDALAGDVSAFLRGTTLAVERRGTAYRSVLATLRRFLAVHRDRIGGNAEDARAAQGLAGPLLARMLKEPPPAGRETAALYRLGRRLWDGSV